VAQQRPIEQPSLPGRLTNDSGNVDWASAKSVTVIVAESIVHSPSNAAAITDCASSSEPAPHTRQHNADDRRADNRPTSIRSHGSPLHRPSPNQPAQA
jgi:hypothetical protein